MIITRRNDRRLASGHSWVRNGDRWTITGLGDDGAIQARHLRTGMPVTLPGGYVAGAVELGYATTVHAAQGVTADTTHGLVDELMTREQLYTMLSRGRHANHLYVPGADAADLHHHGLIRIGVHEPDRRRDAAPRPQPQQPAGLRHHHSRPRATAGRSRPGHQATSTAT